MSSDARPLAGRLALVTGAASGIGRAACVALAAAGARVVGLDKDADGLATLPGLIPHPADVTDEHGMTSAIAEIEAAHGAIDVLVTAAGVLQRPLAPDMAPAKERARVLAVNFEGTYTACALVGARMAARGRGAIVTVASVTGVAPGPVHVYGATKAAVINLTQSLAARWGRAGVRVNAVAPGYAVTPALEKGLAFGILDETALAAATAFGRLVTVEEIAETILFLAGDRASGITGAVVPVDAGHLVVGGFAPFGGV